MSDRAARAARERCIDLIRRYAACITPIHPLAAPRDATEVWHARLATNPVRLPTAPQFTLRLTHDFAPHPRAENEQVGVRPVGYRCELSHTDGRKVFAYHLHPTGASTIKHPHLHVGMRDPDLNYGKKHLTTGLIPLPEIVLCLINEFDIPPLRPDWRDFLTSETGTIRTATQD